MTPARRTRLGSRTLGIATALMAILLVALAMLEVRWVDQVGRAERERLRRALRTSADRIANDFDREVFRAFAAFQQRGDRDQPLAERLADGWERWQSTALEPSMVAAVYVVEPERADAERGGTSAGGELTRLDPVARELRPAPWPPELAVLDQRLESAETARSSGSGRPRRFWNPVLPSAPALLFPVWDAHGRRGGGDSTREPTSTREPALVVVLLDRAVLARTVLPTLVDLHLGPAPRDTGVWVVDRSRADQTLYATLDLPPPPPGPRSDDAMRGLLDLRFFPELRAQGFQRFFDDPEARRNFERAPPSGPPTDDGGRRAGRDGGPGFRPGFGGRPPGGDGGAGREGGPGPRFGGPDAQRAWVLILAPADGSLDAAIERLRRRNLGVGLGVVALLAATSALLFLSARRAQGLARREMELVAGITHELRTPLASIASAADNLADGVVRDPEQVRRYGGLIKGETHRLGALVAQVLDFAGSAVRGRSARSLEPVDLSAIVDRVLDDHRFTIEEKHFTIDRRQSADGVHALAEPEALRRALDNVVGNALKYGEAGRWLGIEIGAAGAAALPPSAGPPRHEVEPAARRRDDERDPRGRVELRVRDRGPGIARADRRRVFEPFYRAASSAAHLHGTGLGLAVTRSVIESLGGSIEIEDSEPGRGTTFLITLPAAPAPSTQSQPAGLSIDDAPIEEAP